MPQAFIIERVLRESPATTWRAVLWADVTVPERQRFYAKTATWLSAYLDATAPQLAALRAGQVTEKVVTLDYADGAAFGDVRIDVVQQLTAFQNRINSVNVWNRYGTYYDGTVWAITDNP